MKTIGSVAHPLNTQRTVIGGKGYEGGNHVYVLPHFRKICIEFDSDFTLSISVRAKNFEKRARKIIEDIPNPVTIGWLRAHDWDIPKEILKRYSMDTSKVPPQCGQVTQ